MRLSQIIAQTPLKPVNASAHRDDPEIDEITIDLRELRPGTLFIARQGYYGDTHERLAEALDLGASALILSRADAVPPQVNIPVWHCPQEDPLLGQLASRFYGHPCQRLRLFGVTGTNGKTSVTQLLAHLLSAAGRCPATLGTLAYRLGEDRLPAVNTTPDALFIHRFARRVLDAGASDLIMEVSSHALAIGRVSGLQFDAVGFTNLSHDHLDAHGSIEAYGAAKMRLFRQYLAPTGRAVAVDSPWGRRALAAAPPSCDTWLLAKSTAAGKPKQIALELESQGSMGMHGALQWSSGARFDFEAPLIGRYNLENIGLALAMIAADNPREMAQLNSALANFPGIAGRLERVAQAQNGSSSVWVDYAHTPEAVAAAAQVLSQVIAAPVVLIGSGGDRDPSKRAPMAAAAAQYAHQLVLSSDNPRSEDPDQILQAMLPGAPKAVVEARRDEAIAKAIDMAASHPVLIAGKGHETYQEVAGRRWHFDDREVARRALVRNQRQLKQVPWLCGWSLERLLGTLSKAAVTLCQRGPRQIAAGAHRPGQEGWAIGALSAKSEAAWTLSSHTPPSAQAKTWLQANELLAAVEAIVLDLVQDALQQPQAIIVEPSPQWHLELAIDTLNLAPEDPLVSLPDHLIAALAVQEPTANTVMIPRDWRPRPCPQTKN